MTERGSEETSAFALLFFFHFFLLSILQNVCRAKRTPHPTHPFYPAPKLSEPHTAFTSQTYLSVDEEGTIIHKRLESDAANQSGKKKAPKRREGGCGDGDGGDDGDGDALPGCSVVSVHFLPSVLKVTVLLLPPTLAVKERGRERELHG